MYAYIHIHIYMYVCMHSEVCFLSWQFTEWFVQGYTKWFGSVRIASHLSSNSSVNKVNDGFCFPKLILSCPSSLVIEACIIIASSQSTYPSPFHKYITLPFLCCIICFEETCCQDYLFLFKFLLESR